MEDAGPGWARCTRGQFGREMLTEEMRARRTGRKPPGRQDSYSFGILALVLIQLDN